MKAISVLRSRTEVGEAAFIEMVIWKLPRSVPGSSHLYKYRLAYVVGGVCEIRFDNEAGKGDHVHFGDMEQPYDFRDTQKLIADFRDAVLGWRR